MMVEPSTRKAGVHVCSSATESGGGMEEKVDDDANDGDWEDHDKNESKQLLILTFKQLSLYKKFSKIWQTMEIPWTKIVMKYVPS